AVSVSAGSIDRVPGFVCTHGAWIRDCVAHGFDASLSRHHQSVPDSAVAAFGGAVPLVERVVMAAVADGDQSADVWRRGAAKCSLSGEPGRIFAGRVDGNADPIFAGDVWHR